MLSNLPVQVVYVQQPIPGGKYSHRPSHYFNSRNNQVLPRPVFTCIDEVYSNPHASQPPLPHRQSTPRASSQKPKENVTTTTRNWRKWLLIIIIIIIIICIIAIIVLLAVFLTR